MTVIGALMLIGAALVLFIAIKTAPRPHRRSQHPLQDQYAPPTDEQT